MSAAKIPKVWICSSCATKNPAADRVCQGCDNDRARVRFPRKLVAPRDQERELWALYDKDKDGFLAPHEFEQLYALLRKPHFGDSLAVFKAIDVNKDGLIVRFRQGVSVCLQLPLLTPLPAFPPLPQDYAEFERAMKNPPPPKSEYNEIVFIKDAMRVLNQTLDEGFFDAEELKRCAELAVADPTELLSFKQKVDRNTAANGNVDIDDLIQRLGQT